MIITDPVETESELDVLKERATKLGISFHPSIGIEKLRDKVNAAVEAPVDGEEEKEKPELVKPKVEKEETAIEKRCRIRAEALRLVRIRVSCMNPAKSEWPGEIITVGNSALGTVRKYVPFNNDEGWHVPEIIYKMMKARQCQVFVKAKTKHGVTVKQSKLINEFAIEVLPDLTKEEMKDLAQRQAMAHSID